MGNGKEAEDGGQYQRNSQHESQNIFVRTSNGFHKEGFLSSEFLYKK